MRKYAQIQVEIWNDSEFRSLTVNAQHLYFVLISHPSLNHAGVGDWRPGRLAKFVGNWERTDVEDAAQELIAGLYVLIDEDTEEFLVRSYLRNSGLLKQPKMATAMTRRLAEVGSSELRGVVVHELARLREEAPSLPGWGSEEALNLLSEPRVDPSIYPLGKGSRKGSGKGARKGKPTPIGKGSRKGSPITSNCNYVISNSVTSSKPGSNDEPEEGSPDGERGRDETPNKYPADFEDWWHLYPRKQGKRKALAEWRRATKRVSQQELNAKTQRFADFHATQGTDKQYIPLPTTWLARDGWDDELISHNPQPAQDTNTLNAWLGVPDNANIIEGEVVNHTWQSKGELPW
ncbi:hypothetical protein ACEE23_01905 [Corynebacterium sp. 32222D000AT]